MRAGVKSEPAMNKLAILYNSVDLLSPSRTLFLIIEGKGKKIWPGKGETLEKAPLRLNCIKRTDGCCPVYFLYSQFK